MFVWCWCGPCLNLCCALPLCSVWVLLRFVHFVTLLSWSNLLCPARFASDTTHVVQVCSTFLSAVFVIVLFCLSSFLVLLRSVSSFALFSFSFCRVPYPCLFLPLVRVALSECRGLFFSALPRRFSLNQLGSWFLCLSCSPHFAACDRPLSSSIHCMSVSRFNTHIRSIWPLLAPLSVYFALCLVFSLRFQAGYVLGDSVLHYATLCLRSLPFCPCHTFPVPSCSKLVPFQHIPGSICFFVFDSAFLFRCYLVSGFPFRLIFIACIVYANRLGLMLLSLFVSFSIQFVMLVCLISISCFLCSICCSYLSVSCFLLRSFPFLPFMCILVLLGSCNFPAVFYSKPLLSYADLFPFL